MFKRILFLCLLSMFFLAGCAYSSQGSIEDSIELKVKLTMMEPGDANISVGVYNPGEVEYHGNEESQGFLTVVDEQGNTLVFCDFKMSDTLASGETFYPLTYTLSVEPGMYKVVYQALGKTPVETQFEIVEKDETLRLYAPYETIDPFTLYTSAN